MRNVFVEGVRSAFIRIIRMLVYIVLGLIIFYIIGLFTSKKAHALTIKQNIPLTFTSNQEMTGTLTGSNQNILQYRWNAVSNSSNYDYIAIRMNPFFDIQDNVTINNGDIYLQNVNVTVQCDLAPTGEYCSYGHIAFPSGFHLDPSSSTFTSGDGDYIINANVIYSGNNNAEGCFFTSEYQNMIICPFKHDIVGVNVYIQGYRLDTLYYKVYLSGNALAINNESTEIVNALQGVTIAQQNTTTVIEQQTTYIQNSSTTQSTTQATNSFTIMSNEITQQLSGLDDLTQVVLAPISLFVELATDTCSPIVLTVPFVNYQATLPCMKPIFNQYFSGLYTVFTTAISAIITYWVSVKTLSLIKDILDCDNDRIEVIDL